jgi:hypothetical protein
MDSNGIKVFLAKLDKDLEGINSPYHFKVCFGAGHTHKYRENKKSGPIKRTIVDRVIIGLRPFVGDKRIA